MPMTLSLDAVNAMDEAAFVAALGDVFEHAPWAAARAAPLRPFATIRELHFALFNAVRGQNPAERLAFFNRFPDLDAEQPALRDGLRAYRARFGFPFLLCTQGRSSGSVRQDLEQRLKRDLASERAAAMDEVFLIARRRLAACVAD